MSCPECKINSDQGHYNGCSQAFTQALGWQPMRHCEECYQVGGFHREFCIYGPKEKKKSIELHNVPEDAVIPCVMKHPAYDHCNQCVGEFIVKDSGEQQKVYGTTVDVKRENFDKFAKLISNQFNHGGDKYKLAGFEDREATDVISSVFGGESEFDWVLGTMTKYIFRFKNFHREKDLLKIATYCYILWLKQGNHLKEKQDEDTDK